MKAQSFPLFGVSFFLIFPYLLLLALRPYHVAGGDEAHQIEAAIQMVRGHGYVSSIYTMPKDLSTGAYQFLFYWPIGYSAILSVFLKLGIQPAAAAALWQGITVIFAFFSWTLAASVALRERAWQVLFLGFLGVHFFSWGNYNTAAFSWGIMGLLTWLILRWVPDSKDVNKTRSFLIASSMLISLLVLFRYQNVTYIPAALLFYTLIQYRKISWRRWVGGKITLCLLPSLVFLSIVYSNHHWGASSSPANTPFGFYPELYWMVPRWVSEFFLGGGFHLEESLPAFIRKIGWNPSFTNALIDFFGIVLFAVLVRFAAKNRRDERAWILMRWFLCSFGFLMAMFLVTTFCFGLNYTEIPGGTRYFHYLIPVFALSFCVLLEARYSMKSYAHSVRTVAAMALLMGFLTISLFAKHRAALYSIQDSKEAAILPTLESLQARESANPSDALYIAADSLFPALVMRGYGNLSLESDPLLQKDAYFSKPTLVVAIHDREPTKEMYSDLANLDKVVSRFQMHKEINAQGVELYWAKMAAGPAPELK